VSYVPVATKVVIAFLHGVGVDRHICALNGFEPHDFGSAAFAFAHVEFTILRHRDRSGYTLVSAAPPPDRRDQDDEEVFQPASAISPATPFLVYGQAWTPF
jgi:hypothetical protein